MIFCRAERGTEHGYWRWRIVDGRTCWYMGEVRVSKNQLVWGGTKQPAAREVVVARKSWSDAELEKLITTPVPPAEPPMYDWDTLNPLDQALIDSEQTPQQRIDGAFEALGISAKHWIEPYIGPSVSSRRGVRRGRGRGGCRGHGAFARWHGDCSHARHHRADHAVMAWDRGNILDDRTGAMNNVIQTNRDFRADEMIHAAAVLIAKCRIDKTNKAELELESTTGETWRITIECVKARDEQ